MKRNKKNNGRKYPCDQCDYKATQKCNLMTHHKYKHEQLFPIINNWNEKNSLELKQSFERVYSIEKGVFEMANFPCNKWTEENSQELKKSFERAYRLKIHKTLTLNYSPLPPGPGLVRVSGQKRQQGRGRGEVEIEHKRENKSLNNWFLRERGMGSNPKMNYQIFFCIFKKKAAMTTFGLKEMGKFL